MGLDFQEEDGEANKYKNIVFEEKDLNTGNIDSENLDASGMERPKYKNNSPESEKEQIISKTIKSPRLKTKKELSSGEKNKEESIQGSLDKESINNGSKTEMLNGKLSLSYSSSSGNQ